VVLEKICSDNLMAELQDWEILVVGNAANGNLNHKFKKIEFSLVLNKYINASRSKVDVILNKLATIINLHFADSYRDTQFYTVESRK
jgi:hypothetical protein